MLSFTEMSVHVNLKLITTTCLVNFLYTDFLNCTVLTAITHWKQEFNISNKMNSSTDCYTSKGNKYK